MFIFQVKKTGKINECHSGSVPLYPNGLLLVVCLGSPVFPPTISWLVIPIIVNPSKCQSLWLFSHIFQERLEAIDPSITHRNTPTTIAIILGIIRIETPTLCLRPSSICCRHFIVKGMSMFNRSFSSHLIPEASATLSQAVSERLSTDNSFISTITLTSPGNSTPTIFGPIKHNEPPEPLSSKIYQLHNENDHNINGLALQGDKNGEV